VTDALHDNAHTRRPELTPLRHTPQASRPAATRRAPRTFPGAFTGAWRTAPCGPVALCLSSRVSTRRAHAQSWTLSWASATRAAQHPQCQLDRLLQFSRRPPSPSSATPLTSPRAVPVPCAHAPTQADDPAAVVAAVRGPQHTPSNAPAAAAATLDGPRTRPQVRQLDVGSGFGVFGGCAGERSRQPNSPSQRPGALIPASPPAQPRRKRASRKVPPAKRARGNSVRTPVATTAALHLLKTLSIE